MKPCKAICVCLTAVLLLANQGYTWYSKTHEYINGQAVVLLPGDLKPFYLASRASIIARANEPDEIRNKAPNTKHCLYIEGLSSYPFGDIPATLKEAYKKYGKDKLEANNGLGTLPWAVVAEYKELVKAFRANDKDAIIRSSAYIGHFIGDAHMPFHTTLNYDCDILGKKGAHGRIGLCAEENLGPIMNDVTMPISIAQDKKDVFQSVMHAISESHGRLYDLLYWDAVALDGSGGDNSAYTKLFLDKNKALLRDCISGAASQTAELWYSAWIEAGRPK